MPMCSKLDLLWPAELGPACHVPGVWPCWDQLRLLTSNEPILLTLCGCLQEVPVRGAAAALAACKAQALKLPMHHGHAQHLALHPVAHCRHLQAASARGGVSCLKPAIP